MSALVTAADLSDDLSRRAVKVIDVQYNLRGTPGRELYAAAHLPGAPHLDLDANELALVYRARGLAPQEALEQAARVFERREAGKSVEIGDHGIPVPDYVEENVSTKVVKIIQSYTGVVDKMVWRKF